MPLTTHNTHLCAWITCRFGGPFEDLHAGNQNCSESSPRLQSPADYIYVCLFWPQQNKSLVIPPTPQVQETQKHYCMKVKILCLLSIKSQTINGINIHCNKHKQDQQKIIVHLAHAPMMFICLCFVKKKA